MLVYRLNLDPKGARFPAAIVPQRRGTAVLNIYVCEQIEPTLSSARGTHALISGSDGAGWILTLVRISDEGTSRTMLDLAVCESRRHRQLLAAFTTVRDVPLDGLTVVSKDKPSLCYVGCMGLGHANFNTVNCVTVRVPSAFADQRALSAA